MTSRETVCPHCGYDFPAPEPPGDSLLTAIAYSGLADVALMVGTIVAAFTCLGSLLGTVVSLATGEILLGLLVYPIAFLLQLAILVVLLRCQDMRPRSR